MENICTASRDVPVDQDLIEELRTAIYDYALKHPDEIDIEDLKNRVNSPEDLANNNVDVNNNKSGEWMLKRFLLFNKKNVELALQKCIETFKFRTTYRMSEFQLHNCLCTEFFEMQPIKMIGKDRTDNNVVIMKLKFYKKIPQFDYFVQRAVLYYFETVDREYELGKTDGLTLVIDCQEFGLSNVDLDLLQFVVKTVPENYLGLIKNYLIYEVPFLLRFVIKAVESWLPVITDNKGNKVKLFQVVNRKTIDDFIEASQREPSLNGTLVDKDGATVPDQVVPFINVAKQFEHIKSENVDKINEHIQELRKIALKAA